MQKLNRYRTFEELKKSASSNERRAVGVQKQEQNFKEFIHLLQQHTVKKNKHKAK